MRAVWIVLTAGLAATVLSACSILPKTEPVDVYRLPTDWTRAVAGSTAAAPWSLRVATPMASEALNSPRIAVLPQADLISRYKGVRWSDPAPVLLRNRIVEGFAKDGRVQKLSTNDSNLQADYELGGELRAFQTEYRAGAVDVVVRLDARLVQASSLRIVASRRFEVRQPLTDTQVPGVIAGFGQASDRLVAQLVDWTLSQASPQPKNQ